MDVALNEMWICGRLVVHVLDSYHRLRYKYIKGKYCKKGGGLTDPKGSRSAVLPLSAAESHALRSKRVALVTDEDTTSFVYQVRAYGLLTKKLVSDPIGYWCLSLVPDDGLDIWATGGGCIGQSLFHTIQIH